MILLIDNYDSFAYNLYQLIGEIDSDIKVYRNDEISLEEIKNLNPDAIFLSPGPGKPENAGICMELVREFKEKIPILGVCLGHQSICAAFGGKISYAGRLMHGKSSKISLNDDLIFNGLDDEIYVGRYHSLSLVIMAVKHKNYNIYGLQFHPESILTPDGLAMIKNFLEAI